MKRVWLVVVAACGHSSSGGGNSPVDGAATTDTNVSADAATSIDAPTAAPTSFGFSGEELPVCDGSYHAPTLGLAAQRLVVGCLPAGSQTTTPIVKFMTEAGAPIGSTNLLTTDGLYYKESRITHEAGKFQVVYEYNCDDTGSWLVGWGWGCVDLREYDDNGDVLKSIQFGQSGLNAHPVLAADSAGEFGVAWVSYDDAYFRRIPADYSLPGGPSTNIFLGPDPLQTDSRSQTRTQIAWDGDGFGVFTIIGAHLYFSRIETGDHVEVSMKDLGAAYSDTFQGELAAVSIGGTYYVAYDDTMSVRLTNFDRNGDVVKTVVAQAGAYSAPQLVTSGNQLYVTTQDAGGRGYITVFDASLTKLAGGLIGGGLGRTMVHPTLAVDGATWIVAYTDSDPGNVKAQALTPLL
jgi:hypothetical protein